MARRRRPMGNYASYNRRSYKGPSGLAPGTPGWDANLRPGGAKTIGGGAAGAVVRVRAHIRKGRPVRESTRHLSSDAKGVLGHYRKVKNIWASSPVAYKYGNTPAKIARGAAQVKIRQLRRNVRGPWRPSPKKVSSPQQRERRRASHWRRTGVSSGTIKWMRDNYLL